MATLAELRALVSSIIQDSSFNDTSLNSYLNRGVSEIAGGVSSTYGSFITPPLPNLFTISTVTTSTSLAYVSMPATFQRALRFVSNSDGQEIDIYNSMIEFSSDYPLMDGSGDVISVIEQGGNLYYQKIPTVAKTLTLHFFRLPVAMSLDASTPDGIPSHLAESLLVNFACKEIFSITGNSESNISQYVALFNAAVRTLENTIPNDTRSLILGD